jgi:hypothetical protein
MLFVDVVVIVGPLERLWVACVVETFRDPVLDLPFRDSCDSPRLFLVAGCEELIDLWKVRNSRQNSRS